MEVEEQEEREVVVIKRRPFVDGKTLVIGGGIIALVAFLLFRGKGGGGARGKTLTFRLRGDGLWLGHYQKFATYSEAIARIQKEGKNAIELIIAGDVPQGEVDKALAAFASAGIAVLIRQTQSVASVYQRGLGGSVA